MKKYNVKKGYELTRKQLQFISQRPMSTIINWENENCKIPEHIEKEKKHLEKLLRATRSKIEEFEDGFK